MDLRGARGTLGGQELRGLGPGFGIQAGGAPLSAVISAVQQQDYLASVWLRRRDRLENVSCFSHQFNVQEILQVLDWSFLRGGDVLQQ